MFAGPITRHHAWSAGYGASFLTFVMIATLSTRLLAIFRATYCPMLLSTKRRTLMLAMQRTAATVLEVSTCSIVYDGGLLTGPASTLTGLLAAGHKSTTDILAGVPKRVKVTLYRCKMTALWKQLFHSFCTIVFRQVIFNVTWGISQDMTAIKRNLPEGEYALSTRFPAWATTRMSFGAYLTTSFITFDETMLSIVGMAL